MGAFEEDDDDIYAVDTMDNYDVITGGSKEKNDDFGWTRPQQAIQGWLTFNFLNTLQGREINQGFFE